MNNVSFPTFRNRSIITKADSYKASHYLQYPKKTEKVFSYIESRGGMYSETLFFGLQGFIKQYLLTPVTMEDIEFAEYFWTNHIPGLKFNRPGWEYIVKKYQGKLPVEIKAVKEGRKVTARNVVVSIENTDPKAFWLTSFLETILLRGVWPATTGATRSYEIKKVCRNFLELTSDITNDNVKLNWMLHDFGMRGGKAEEATAIAGAGHLINFFGTDTTDAIFWANDYYNSGICGYSIPASEHSTATMYGRNGEVEYLNMMIDTFGKPGAIFANVADSYDVFGFVNKSLPQVKQKLIDSGATMVVRPDSGDPVDTPLKVLQSLADVFDYTVNSKGYKVLNTVRLIQGDGVNEESIRLILEGARARGFSAENFAFGCGGYLLDAYNRDTQKWAMKCSYAQIEGEYIDVYKEPITDPGKTSKRGKLELVSKNNEFKTVREVELSSRVSQGWTSELEVVYRNGELLREQSFEEIRKLANN